MNNPDNQPQNITLGKASRIILAFFSFIFALMMLPMALEPHKPENGLLNFAPSVFCFLIVGACIFPAKIRGYFGDLIALSVIAMSIGYLIVWSQDPKPGQNPFMFAGLFGGSSLTYLVKRYRKKTDEKNS